LTTCLAPQDLAIPLTPPLALEFFVVPVKVATPLLIETPKP
jgi:hypothetical protein